MTMRLSCIVLVLGSVVAACTGVPAPSDADSPDPCGSTCNPLSQDCVTPSQGCYPQGCGSCILPGTGGVDADCVGHYDCQAGLACLQPDSAVYARCRRLCDVLATTSGCGVGQVCIRLSDGTWRGRAEIGYCTAPGPIDAGTAPPVPVNCNSYCDVAVYDCAMGPTAEDCWAGCGWGGCTDEELGFWGCVASEGGLSVACSTDICPSEGNAWWSCLTTTCERYPETTFCPLSPGDWRRR